MSPVSLEDALEAIVRRVVREELRNGRGSLLVLAEGFGPIKGETLLRWARQGRLRSFCAARGQRVAWEGDVVAAVEAEGATTRHEAEETGSQLGALLAADDLEAAPLRLVRGRAP